MSTKKINAGDTLTVGDLTDAHLGAVIEVGPTDGGVTFRFRLDRIECYGTSQVKMLTTEGGAKHADLGERVRVITPPPVVQPEMPTVPGQCIRIEGDDEWRAVLIDGGDVIAPFCDADGNWWGWDEILDERAKGRRVIVSEPPRWPEEAPEAPVRIGEGGWPDDDKHLREWEWVDRDGDPWWWVGRDEGKGGWTLSPAVGRSPKPYCGPWTRGERVA